jgi:acyl-CoA oxidase
LAHHDAIIGILQRAGFPMELTYRAFLTLDSYLYGFTLLEENLSWYLINGRLSGARAEAITEYIDTRLLPRLRPHAESLVDAFLLPPELVRTTLARDERERQMNRQTLVRN